jgi:hypothetical protein
MKWPDTWHRSDPIESTRVLIRQYQKASALKGKLRVLRKIDHISLNSQKWIEAINLMEYLESAEKDTDAKTLLTLYRDVQSESIDILRTEFRLLRLLGRLEPRQLGLDPRQVQD